MRGTFNRRSSKPKTFPKTGAKKQNDTIKKLKDRVRYLEKKIKFFEKELFKFISNPEQLTSPKERVKIKAQEEQLPLDEWRKDFLKKFKESLKQREKVHGSQSTKDD